MINKPYTLAKVAELRNGNDAEFAWATDIARELATRALAVKIPGRAQAVAMCFDVVSPIRGAVRVFKYEYLAKDIGDLENPEKWVDWLINTTLDILFGGRNRWKFSGEVEHPSAGTSIRWAMKRSA